MHLRASKAQLKSTDIQELMNGYLSLRSLLTKTLIRGMEEKIDVRVVPIDGFEYGSRKGVEEFDVSKIFPPSSFLLSLFIHQDILKLVII